MELQHAAGIQSTAPALGLQVEHVDQGGSQRPVANTTFLLHSQPYSIFRHRAQSDVCKELLQCPPLEMWEASHQFEQGHSARPNIL